MSTAETTLLDLAWTFGDRCRKARRHAGLSHQEVADLLEIPVRRYTAWESDGKVPRNLPEVAVDLAKLFDVPADWLIGIRTGSEWWAPETSLHLLTPSEPFEDDDTRLHAERFGYQPAR